MATPSALSLADILQDLSSPQMEQAAPEPKSQNAAVIQANEFIANSRHLLQTASAQVERLGQDIESVQEQVFTLERALKSAT